MDRRLAVLEQIALDTPQVLADIRDRSDKIDQRFAEAREISVEAANLMRMTALDSMRFLRRFARV